MKKTWHLLIVDDHPMVSVGTKTILEQMDMISEVGIAKNGQVCKTYVQQYKPDIVLLDYNLPGENGYQILQQIKSIDQDIQVVIFTGVDVAPMYNELLELGVSGVMTKNASDEQIKNMIRCVIEGQTVIPLDLYRQLRLTKTHSGIMDLTPQEKHLMSLVVDGYTHDQIAKVEFISKRTVDNYLKKIYSKLEAKSRVQAVEKYLAMKRE
jgi:two-component system competent response regulator ComA